MIIIGQNICYGFSYNLRVLRDKQLPVYGPQFNRNMYRNTQINFFPNIFFRNEIIAPRIKEHFKLLNLE